MDTRTKKVLDEFGFNTALCKIEVDETRFLLISQKGKNLSFGCTPEFWRPTS